MLEVVSLTLFNILWTAGESGVYRIFPISRGLTEFHTIFVTGLDSRVCIRSLQKGASMTNDTRRLEKNPESNGQETKGLRQTCSKMLLDPVKVFFGLFVLVSNVCVRVYLL